MNSMRTAFGQVAWRSRKGWTELVRGQRLRRFQASESSSITRHLASLAAAHPLDAECRYFSQNGEDGIVLALLSRYGVQHGHTCEFGFSIYENNTISSALYFGIHSTFIDGSHKVVKQARQVIDRLKSPGLRAQQAFLTQENVDATLTSLGLPNAIDVISIDVDGNDYWLWNAISSIRARIVVVEYNASFGSAATVSVPYDPHFNRLRAHPSGLYHGASLKALVGLGIRKGYAFLGVDRAGLNAYFVDAAIAHTEDIIPTPDNGFRSHSGRIAAGMLQQSQEHAIAHLPVVRL